MNNENIVLCVFNPLNLVQSIYYAFLFRTREYLSLGGEGIKIIPNIPIGRSDRRRLFKIFFFNFKNPYLLQKRSDFINLVTCFYGKTQICPVFAIANLHTVEQSCDPVRISSITWGALPWRTKKERGLVLMHKIYIYKAWLCQDHHSFHFESHATC